MALFSKNYYSNGSVKKMTPYVVLGGGDEKIDGVRQAIVISAYYSKTFIIDLFKKFKKKIGRGAQQYLCLTASVGEDSKTK
jgi:hypothetical protein